MKSGSPPRIVFLDRETLSPQTRLREPSFPHRLDVFGKTAPAEVAQRIADAEIVITNKAPLRRDAIVSAKNLRLVAVAATGTDVVDAKACAERGITVSNIRNYAVNTVPEHTFALIFALRRSITAYRDAVIKGRWQEAGQFCFFDYPVRDLAGSTLGIVGDGVLGQAVAALGRAFGMNVFLDIQGGRRNGPALHAIRRSYAQKRCNHSPLPAHAVDKEHDCGPRVRIDGTPSVAYQYRTRRACR